jgi:peptidoglycan hydrolase CwlO-like protein
MFYALSLIFPALSKIISFLALKDDQKRQMDELEKRQAEEKADMIKNHRKEQELEKAKEAQAEKERKDFEADQEKRAEDFKKAHPDN